MLGVPCRAGYASAAGPTAGEVASALRAAGARRVAVAAYFLATGRLYRTAAESARAAGAVAVAAPLGAARELAHLILARLDHPAVRAEFALDRG
jgi:sirohydrochlorin ferrochelatase